MDNKIIWLDVGTHRGQEYRSVFCSKFELFLKLLRYVKKGPDRFSKIDEIKKIWHLHEHFTKNRSNFYCVFIEANPFMLSHSVYKFADAVFSIALGSASSPSFGLTDLYLVDADKGGQGSSIYLGKPNVSKEDAVLCAVTSPSAFFTSLKNKIDDKYMQNYKIILRLNCEGSEDDVIYTARNQFGDKLSLVLGSLKDVRGVKGDDAYNELMDFIQKEQIDFSDFSSYISTWEQSHSKIYNLIEGCNGSKASP